MMRRVAVAVSLICLCVTVASAASLLNALERKKLEHKVAQSVRQSASSFSDSSASQPSATVRIDQSLVTQLTAIIVPFLESFAMSTPIPAEDETHFSFKSFNLSSFSLSGVSVAFTPPNLINLAFTNVSLVVPWTEFHVYEKVFGHKFGCHGTFTASDTGSNVGILLTIGRSPINGSLLVTEVTPTATFGGLTVNHKWDSDLCSIAGKVIGFFIGGINAEMKSLVEEVLPAKLGNIIQNKSNTVFGKIPFRLASDPVVTNNGMTFDVQLVPTNNVPPSDLPIDLSFLPRRDISLAVTQNQLNLYLDYIMTPDMFIFNRTLPARYNTSMFQKLIPAVYQACPNCLLNAAVTLNSVPQVRLSQNGDGSFAVRIENAEIALRGLNATSELLDTLATHGPVSMPPQSSNNKSSVYFYTLGVNATAVVQNFSTTGNYSNILKFDLALTKFQLSEIESLVGHLPIPVLNGLMEWALQFALSEFNQHFTGLPLPAVDGIDFEKLAVVVGSGVAANRTSSAFGVAVDVILPGQV